MKKIILAIALVSCGLISCGAVTRAHAADPSIKRLTPANVNAGAKYQVLRNAAIQSAAIKRTILANYRFYEDCIRNANSEDVIALETDDFQSSDEDGNVSSKTEGDNDLRLVMDHVTAVHGARVRINRLTVEHNVVVAIVTLYFDATITGPDQKPHRITTNGVSRDTWIPVGGEWKIRRSESLRNYTTLDGKIVR